MAERPAQAQGSLDGESRRLIPALWLGMALFLVVRPDRLRHRFQRQDAHALFLRTLQDLRAKVRLGEEHEVHGKKYGIEVVTIHGRQCGLRRVYGEPDVAN